MILRGTLPTIPICTTNVPAPYREIGLPASPPWRERIFVLMALRKTNNIYPRHHPQEAANWDSHAGFEIGHPAMQIVALSFFHIAEAVAGGTAVRDDNRGFLATVPAAAVIVAAAATAVAAAAAVATDVVVLLVLTNVLGRR